MREFVGVALPAIALPTKRDLLLFDRIGIVGLDECLGTLEPHVAANLNWLASQNAIFDIPGTSAEALAISGLQPEVEVWASQAIAATILNMVAEKSDRAARITDRQFIEGLVTEQFSGAVDVGRVTTAISEQLATYVSPMASGSSADPFESELARILRLHLNAVNVASPDVLDAAYQRLQAEVLERALRLFTQHLRTRMNVDATALLTGPPSAVMSIRNATPDTVIDVVLHNLPMPSDDTPLDAIMDLRQDEELKTSLRQLRQWMRSVAASSISADDISYQLEDLLDAYQTHLRNQTKLVPGVLRTFIVTTADIVEGIVKLQFGKAARALFAFQDRRVELARGEMGAPGREIAYLVNIRERLNSSYGA